MNFNLTLIAQMIAFAVFIWLTMRFIWPPIVAAMEERQKRIADGLSAADRAQRDLSLAQEKASGDLKEAKDKAAEIIDQASRRATRILEEAKEQAQKEGKRLVENAQAEIDMEINRAREELRQSLSGLVLQGTEQVLAKEVDAKAHEQLLKQLATEL